MIRQVITSESVSYAIAMCLDTSVPKSDQMRLAVDLSVELMDGHVAYLPSGFITDFHSVPPILWSLWPPFNTKTNLAAMVHDWLYMNWEQHVGRYPELAVLDEGEARHYCDDQFLHLMDQFTTDRPIRNYLYYVAVRFFGFNNFRRFRATAKQTTQ